MHALFKFGNCAQGQGVALAYGRKPLLALFILPYKMLFHRFSTLQFNYVFFLDLTLHCQMYRWSNLISSTCQDSHAHQKLCS